MKMENLQEQLINITAHRDELQAQLEQSQEHALQYMRSVENLQMVLEQFQRGIDYTDLFPYWMVKYVLLKMSISIE
jgi:chromosome segregation ATPase